MSMLAERKVKQRWSLNPRGKDWSEDSSKYGQKILEKMGWSKGKGLGANENGIVEHVKISYKNDSKGMGYKETNNQWTEHDSNFNALLESLSGEKLDKNDIKLSSLEQKSQSSKVRVHYKKFTRGKDLSRCTEKDLACIFGKKSLKETPAKTDENNYEKETKKDNFTHNGGSMVDYFKRKLPSFGKSNSYVVGSNGVLKKESESEEESHVGFGFKREKKRKSEEESHQGVKRAKKGESDEDQNKGLSNPAFDPLFNNVDVKKHVLNTIEEEESEENAKKIKNEGRKREDSDDSAYQSCQNDDKKQAMMENGEKKKKKKKRNTVAIDNPNFDENCDDSQSFQMNEEFEVKKKKEKNRNTLRNESLAIDNPNFDDNAEDSFKNDNFEVKRKKKKKISSLALDNPNFDESDMGCENSYTTSSFEVKRKKKKKNEDANDSKIEKNSFALDNPNFDTTNEEVNSYVDSNFEVKRKKKKKNGNEEVINSKIDENSFALDNPNFDNSTNKEANNYVDSNFEIRRKKKKNKKEDMAIDNPSFNDCLNTSQNAQIGDLEQTNTRKIDEVTDLQETKNEETEPTFDLILNVTCTPSLPKPEQKPSSAKRRKSVRFSDVNEERIIPNIEDIKNRDELFDINSRVIANGLNDNTNLNLEEMSKKIDGFQAEIENDINEAKVTKIGEKLPDGTRLKFQYAKFGRTPIYMRRSTSRAQSSYKHLIKGDVILGFNNTNLHEIAGYGVKIQQNKEF